MDIYSLDISLYDDEERELLQVSLGKKLVYAPVGANGELYEYPASMEAYVSASCGHALCPVDRMDGIQERIKSFEKR